MGDSGKSNVLSVVLAAGMMLGAWTARGELTVSVATGNWEADGTWSAGAPQPGDDVVIQSGHTITMNGSSMRSINSLTITGKLTHAANKTETTDKHRLFLDVSGDLTIDASGMIDVNGKGFVEPNGLGSNGGGRQRRRLWWDGGIQCHQPTARLDIRVHYGADEYRE